MEEWRSGKDSRGRVAEAQWKLMMQGTKVFQSLSMQITCFDKRVSCCKSALYSQLSVLTVQKDMLSTGHDRLHMMPALTSRVCMCYYSSGEI